MRVADFQYHIPTSVEEAVALLEQHQGDVLLLGGGTDLVPALKYALIRAGHVVSMREIPGLSGVTTADGGGLTLGALTTLRDAADSPLVRERVPALAEAAAQAGSPLLRNRGTLGGNVCLDTRCWYYNQTEAWRASRAPCQKAGGEECYVNQKQNVCVALFSADTPPALIVVGAHATLAGPRGERTLPVEALYSGDGLKPLAKADAEILTSVTVPAPSARWGTAYLKHSVRESIDFPVLGVAAAVGLQADGFIAEARIALTGIKTAPVRLVDVEVALRGHEIPAEGDRDLAELATHSVGPLFLSDTVPHKRRLAGLMTVEAVTRAARVAHARSAS